MKDMDEREEAPEWIWLQRFEDGEKEFSMLWFESDLRPSTNPEHQRPFHAIGYIRTDLAATRMRERCVSKVKELRDEWDAEAQNPRADLKNLIGVRARAKVDAARAVITELGYVALEGTKEQ